MRVERVGTQHAMAILICLFAVFFLVSQLATMWESVQARQVESESFKIERESGRKEVVHSSLQFDSFAFAAYGIRFSLPVILFSDVIHLAADGFLNRQIVARVFLIPRAPPR